MQTQRTKLDFGSKILKKELFVKDLMYIAAQGSTSERAFDEDAAEKNIDLKRISGLQNRIWSKSGRNSLRMLFINFLRKRQVLWQY